MDAHANADANHVLGLAYMNARRYDDARGAFAAQYGVGADSAAAYLLTGGMLLDANLPELAAQDAQKALEITPNLPLAHFMLGEVLSLQIRCRACIGALRTGTSRQSRVSRGL